MKEAWGWIRDIAIAVVIAAVLLFFFKPIIIQQESMQPNFYSKDKKFKESVVFQC